jgi:pilus assembly protein FimV
VAASAAPIAAPAVAASVKPVAPAVVKPAAAPVAAVVEAPWYMQTWAWAAAAGAVLVLLLLALLGQRKKAPPAARSPSSLADSFVVPPVAADGADDVDQNELLDQLAEHPDDIYLHLELVTLYYSRRDVDHFEAAAEAMHAHITDPQQDEWQDVVHMGEDLAPGHPLFAASPAQPLHDESAVRAAFDIDDYAAEAPAAAPPMPPMPPMPTQPKPVSEYHYNFDLTAPHAARPSGEHGEPAPFAAPSASGAEPPLASPEAVSDWRFDEAGDTGAAFAGSSFEQGGFSDDPIDTKLDLARAYLDMGDADGARAMLGEVLKEGSQMQQDTARRLLETLN